MSAIASIEDHWLEGPELVRALAKQKRLSASDAQLALKELASPSEQHPVERLAALHLRDECNLGEPLEIEALTVWLAAWAGQPYYRIDPLKIDVAKVTTIGSSAFSEHYGILIVEVALDSITVASAQPFVRSWEADLANACHRRVHRVVANPTDIRRLTLEFYRLTKSISGARQADSAERPIGSLEQAHEVHGIAEEASAYDTPVVEVVDWLLQYAFEKKASDIHIEPRRDGGHLRLRLDGQLHDVYQFPAAVSMAAVSRLKSLGRMNVAEKRKPQDGRIKTTLPDGNAVELRLSTLPTAFGEKMVMRVFDPKVLLKSFDQLGFSSEDLSLWQSLITQPNGIILVTGPTGSGKTTTLYSTLRQLATPTVNLCTIEDPIEMVEPSFNQMQVQPQIGLNFASGVRALMRQDPDIIMIGEIRDLETAEVAIQAALTGHLVLSTLHTNDAAGAISRLLELGMPAYLLKATVLGVMAQRLVRVLCRYCKASTRIEPQDWDEAIRPWQSAPPRQMARAVGCDECRGTGFQGRAGIYEILPLSEGVKALITIEADTARIRTQAYREGMRSLRIAGALKVAAGTTTLEEVLRVTPRHGA